MWLAALSTARSASAETLDRVVASIENIAITQSDVEREYRFEHFPDARWPPPPPDGAALEQVCKRLTYQKLLALEEGTNPPEAADLANAAAERLASIRKGFGPEEDFQAALRTLGMGERELLERIAEQQRILRLIDQRLRPAAVLTVPEIETYYRETFVPEYTRRNVGPAPTLAEVETQIREILVEKKIDQLLGKWLEELASSRRVRFHSF